MNASNINRYISSANKEDMLTIELEREFGLRLQQNPDDSEAMNGLVLPHLRLVNSIARKFEGYQLPIEDLIQAGNVGLVTAARKFDPSVGVRFSSYAQHWIRSEILDFIVGNVKMFRIARTKEHRKLFFNLKIMRSKLQAESGRFSSRMTDDQAAQLAAQLNVSTVDVREMEQRLSVTEFSIHQGENEDEDSSTSLVETAIMGTLDTEPVEVLKRLEREDLVTNKIPAALGVLDERCQKIISERWINDDGKTLVELAEELGISAERVRQLEQRSLKQIKKAICEE